LMPTPCDHAERLNVSIANNEEILMFIFFELKVKFVALAFLCLPTEYFLFLKTYLSHLVC
jgi:hypothetical protein